MVTAEQAARNAAGLAACRAAIAPTLARHAPDAAPVLTESEQIRQRARDRVAAVRAARRAEDLNRHRTTPATAIRNDVEETDHAR